MYDARRPQTILVGTLAAETTSATGVFGYSEVLMEDARVSRLYCKVTTAINSASAATAVQFRAQPTYGSSSGAVVLGTIILPHNTAANVMIYKDIDPVNVPANYQIIADVTVASTTAGAALAGVLMQYDPETAANQDIVASA